MLTRWDDRYYITFINDCSRYIYVYLLKHKEEGFNIFKIYKSGGRKIKTFRNDKCREYFTIEFKIFWE